MSISVDQVIEAKCYIGTLRSHSNPKTRKYWLWVENNMIILNPEIIAKQLDVAKKRIQEIKKDWWEILVITDKSIFRDEIEKLSDKRWWHYLNYNVPAWVLTNFDTLLSRVRSMNDLREYIKSEEYESLTKKEKLTKIRQLEKVEMLYKWVKWLTKKPSLVIVLDGKYMSKFVDELVKMKMENIVLATSDFDRWWNDDSLVVTNVSNISSIRFVLEYILT